MARNEMFDEFDRMDNNRDYRRQLGIVGLQKIIDDNMATSRTQRRGSARSDYAFEEFPSFVSQQKDQMERLIDANEDVHIADDSLTSLVDKIRSYTYEVRITNALHGIVLPLSERMEVLHLEDRLEALNNHRENVLYQQEIVSAINELNNQIEESFVRRLVLEYRQFMRNPVWNSIRLLNKMVISPVLGLTKTLLFGRKKRESDTDRIVRSVNELTEFMRTGMIDREKGFIQRVIEGGLVGAPAKALARGVLSKTTGIGVGAAQAREDAKASGTMGNRGFLENLVGNISNKLYGNEIIRRGHMQQMGDSKSIEDLFNLFEQSTEHESRTASLVEQTNKILSRIENFGYEQVRNQRQLFEHELEKDVALEQQRFIETSRHASVMDIMKADAEYQGSIAKLAKKDNKINEKQLDEAEETNRRLFMQNILKGLGVITSGIGSLVKSIGGILGGALGGRALGGIMGGKGGAVKGGSGMFKRLGKRIPIIGTLLAGLGMAGGATASDLSPEQKAGELSVMGGGLAGGAAGAALGASVGSVVPVVGTAIGGILGGVAGSILGEEAIKPFKDEVGSFMLSVGDSIGDAWDSSSEYVSEKWSAMSNWVSSSLPSFGDTLSNSTSKLTDKFDNAKSWITDSISGIGDSITNAWEKAKEKTSSFFSGDWFGDDEEEADVTPVAKPQKAGSMIYRPHEYDPLGYRDSVNLATENRNVTPMSRGEVVPTSAPTNATIDTSTRQGRMQARINRARNRFADAKRRYAEQNGNPSVTSRPTNEVSAPITANTESRATRSGGQTVQGNATSNNVVTNSQVSNDNGADRSASGEMRAVIDAFKKKAMEDGRFSIEEMNILKGMLAELAKLNSKADKNDKATRSPDGSFTTSAGRSSLTSVTTGE